MFVPEMVAPPADPASVLFGRTRTAILSLFFTRPDESFYLREVVRRTGCGTGAVQRELVQLTSCGILRKEWERFFRANPESPLFAPLMQLVVRSAGLADRLRTALDPVREQVEVAFIFGSFARGEQGRSSDVDVMVITRDESLGLERIGELLREVQDAVGREVNPFVMSARELGHKNASGNHFIRRVLAGEKTFLKGGGLELKRVAEERVVEAAPAGRDRNRRSARGGRARP